ncbi:MAG: hypothetical protein DDT29_02253 [Dehalococcoidia bacterium]|nr:hypothetical protein [Bacillota bacterium]
MYETSTTVKGIKKATLLFDACYAGSRTAFLLEGMAAFFAKIFAGSVLGENFWRKDVSLSLWHNSMLFLLFRLVQELFKKLLGAVSSLLNQSLEKSKSYQSYSYLISHLSLLFLLLGLLAVGFFYLFPLLTALTLLAAILGGFLILSNPSRGLFIFAFALPFMPNIGLLLLAGLVGLSFGLRRLRQRRLALQSLSLEPAIVLYLLIAVGATVASVNLSGSLRDLAIYFFAFVLFFVLINQIENEKELKGYLNFLLLGAFFVALYGIYQYLVGTPLPAGWVDVEQNPAIRTRVYSVFGNPNVLASYLVLLTPLSCALFLGTKKIAAKFSYFALTAILCLTLLLTFSRGGWLGLLVSLLVFALLKDRRMLILILIVLLAAVALLPDVFLQRLSTIGSPRDTSNAYRFRVWQESMGIIEDFPLTGVGLGHKSFMRIYPLYMLDREKSPFHTHNSFLQILVETGIIGLFVFFWLLGSYFKRGIKAIASCRNKELKYLMMASLSVTVGILTQGMGDVIIYLPKIIILFWLNIALLFLCIKFAEQQTASAEVSTH